MPTRSGLTFETFAKGWWEPEHVYARGKVARGKRISRSYLQVRKSNLTKHLLPAFGRIKLENITPRMVEEWLLDFENNTGLGPISANHCLATLRIMLGQARRDGLIAVNPAAGLEQLSERGSKPRGVLTGAEVRKLLDDRTIDKVWDGNAKHYTLNLLAAATGARLGELRGLTVGRVHSDHIELTAVWDRVEGLRAGTKTSAGRTVTIPTKVSRHLAALVDSLTWKEPGDLVFSGQNRARPLLHLDILRRFYRALTRIGVSEMDRLARVIVFHSWRHWLTSALRQAKVSDVLVGATTGHVTGEMIRHYESHVDLTDLGPVLAVQEKLL